MLIGRTLGRGLSVVELLVGVAIGLFILAGATMAVTGQLSNNRRLLADTQLQQDLRVAADIITHDVRRAGYTGAAYLAVWPANPASGLVNAYAAMSPESAASAVTAVTYSASSALNPGQENNALDNNEVSGARWDQSTHALEIQLGNGNWQALTDPNSMLITGFDITVDSHDQDVPCGADPGGTTCTACALTYGRCAQGPTPCPLKVTTRDVNFVVTAKSAIDPSVTRSLRWSVRARNDVVRESC